MLTCGAVYEEEAAYDAEELADRFNTFECDINDVESVFRVLNDRTRNTALAKSFLGLMQSLLTLGLDAGEGHTRMENECCHLTNARSSTLRNGSEAVDLR